MKKHELVIHGETRETYCIHCGLVIDDWLVRDSIETKNFKRLIYCDVDENSKL